MDSSTPKPENTKQAYQQYLQSDHWKNLRSQAIARDGGKCLRCKDTHELHVHHRFYRSNWLNTKLTDLQTLCRECHATHHGFKEKPKPEMPALNTWQEVKSARSRRLITRIQFKLLQAKFKPSKFKQSHRKKRKHGKPWHRSKHPSFFNNSVRRFSTQQPHWVRRGNSDC